MERLNAFEANMLEGALKQVTGEGYTQMRGCIGPDKVGGMATVAHFAYQHHLERADIPEVLDQLSADAQLQRAEMHDILVSSIENATAQRAELPVAA